MAGETESRKSAASLVNLSLSQPVQRSADIRLQVEELAQRVTFQLPHSLRSVGDGENLDVQLRRHLRQLCGHESGEQLAQGTAMIVEALTAQGNHEVETG